jgi:hypothetical protein
MEKRPTIEDLKIIRWNIDFIASEVPKIDSSQEVKKEVLQICDSLSALIAKKVKNNEADEFDVEFRRAMKGFGDIIKKIENEKGEEDMSMLLMTHVADMIVALNPEEAN